MLAAGGGYLDRQYYDFFILRKSELDVSKIRFQESEVQQIRLVSVSELNRLIENKEVVDRSETYRALLEYIFRG